MTARTTRKGQMKEDLKDLVHEVTKERPNLSKVKTLVKKLDIEFSQDPLEQMSLVLQSLGRSRDSKLEL
jgi:hypothetical protein